MKLCPQQHPSDDAEFCSVCGLAMEQPEPPPEVVEPLPGPVAPPPDPKLPACPVCAAPRAALQSSFCEECGYNFCFGETGGQDPGGRELPLEVKAVRQQIHPSTPAERWEIEAHVLSEAEPEAPQDAVVRIFPLDLPDLLIGRRSERRGIAPEIALETDDGISHRHARLRRRADGGFELLDLGSANGTSRNGTPAPSQVPVPLGDGDRLRLGRWTELHLRKL